MSRLFALAVGLFVGGVLSTGCGVIPPLGGVVPPPGSTPDPRPLLARVEVANSRGKPNLLLLVDASGSMTEPIDRSLPACKLSNGTVCGGDQPCPSSCPTRWRAVQGAMGTFLSQNTTLARLGLGTYPDVSGGDSCGASTRLRIRLPSADDDASLMANASEVNAALQSIPNEGPGRPAGGSPTGPSLRYVGSIPELRTAERADFVLLLTDGAPNCNPDFNPNYACYCTLDSFEFCKMSPYDKLGCMDHDNSVGAIQDMKSQGIRTFVVGFGSEVLSASQTQYAVSAMATEGGFARQCQSNTDCGPGDSCDVLTNLCHRRFYPANNQAELASALQLIGEKVAKEKGQESCLLPIAPSANFPPQELLQVSLNGAVLAPGPDSWSLTNEGLRFTGSACDRIAAATSSAPVVIEVRGPVGW